MGTRYLKDNLQLCLIANVADNDLTPHTSSDSDKTTWFDVSGNSRDATITNSDWDSTSGWVSSPEAWHNEYNASAGDYMSVPYNAALVATTWTYEVWLKQDSSPSYNMDLFYHGTDNVNGFQIYMNSDTSGKTGYIRFNTCTTGGRGSIYSNASQANTNLLHLVFTKSGTATKMYINGTLQTDQTTSTYTAASSGIIQLQGVSGGTHSVDAKFYVHRIYNIALTQQQVTDNYGAGLGYNWEASAEGSSTSEGSATGRVSRKVSAEGSSTSEGSATGRVGKRGSAEGSSTSEGSATGRVGMRSSAEGSSSSEGYAEGEVSSGWVDIQGSAEGLSTSEGSARATVQCYARAEGSSTSEGSARATVRCYARAEGSSTSEGSARATCTLFSSAEGLTQSIGIAEGIVNQSFVYMNAEGMMYVNLLGQNSQRLAGIGSHTALDEFGIGCELVNESAYAPPQLFGESTSSGICLITEDGITTALDGTTSSSGYLNLTLDPNRTGIKITERGRIALGIMTETGERILSMLR